MHRAGHIPGASFLDVDRDLSAPPGERGRHPLPLAADFTGAAGRAGIGAGVRVVAYDEAGEGGAARLWWLLRHFGHDEAAVLDGGFAAWRAAGLGAEPGEPSVAEKSFEPEPRDDDTAGPDTAPLVDARVPERFRGEVEPVDPVAGHVEGARNVPFASLLRDGRLLPADELRARLPARRFTAYCGSGVTACTLVLAAELAGSGPALLWPGGWSEYVHPARHDPGHGTTA